MDTTNTSNKTGHKVEQNPQSGHDVPQGFEPVADPVDQSVSYYRRNRLRTQAVQAEEVLENPGEAVTYYLNACPGLTTAKAAYEAYNIAAGWVSRVLPEHLAAIPEIDQPPHPQGRGAHLELGDALRLSVYPRSDNALLELTLEAATPEELHAVLMAAYTLLAAAQQVEA